VESFGSIYAPVLDALPEGIVVADPVPSLSGEGGLIRTQGPDGLVLFSDRNHLSPAGARQLVPLVEDVLRKLESGY
jgi:lysophospholipase L1-like esterase